MNSVDFNKPQRESVISTVFSMGFFYRKLISLFWPLLVIYLFKGDISSVFSNQWTYVLIFVFIIIVAIQSFLSWKYFFFYIKNNEFTLEKGFLKKEIISIPIEKIISVNTNQKLLHQLLEVVEVQIDSVGSDQKEVKLRAVKKHFAKDLIQELSNYKNLKKDDEPLRKQSEKKKIISLSFNSLFKIGIARNHLQGLLILLAFISQIRYNLEDFFEDEINSALGETIYILDHSDFIIWAIIVLFFIFLAIITSMIRTFLSYFNLQMLQVKKAFILQSGLLKRKSITVPFSRIQAVKKTTNPLQYLLKITTLQLVQASSKEQQKETEKVLIPGCTQKQKEIIYHTIFNGVAELPISELKPHWALRNRLLFIKLLLLIPTSILCFFFPYLWWILPIVLIWVVIESEIAYRYRKYLLNQNFFQIHSGSITRTVTRLETHKIQSVHMEQTFFQRKRNTATLQLGLAGANVRISYIPYKNAIVIKDYLLHKIHKDKRNWM